MTASRLAILAADLASLILIAEACLLIGLRARRGKGLPYVTTLLIAAAGLGLLLALRAALAGDSPFMVLAGLSLGGVAHVADLARRLARS